MVEGVINGEGVLRTLGIVIEGLSDIKPSLELIAQNYSKSILETLVVGGRPPYADILPESRAQRKFDQSTPPNWDSGILAQAAIATTSGVFGSAFLLTSNSVRIGLDPNARADFRRDMLGFVGVDKMGRNINQPARNAMEARPEDTEASVGILRYFIDNLVTGRK